MIVAGLGGIVLAAKASITNASAEGLNSVVQMLNMSRTDIATANDSGMLSTSISTGSTSILVRLKHKLPSFHQKAG